MRLWILSAFLSLPVASSDLSLGEFSGRISKINTKANLLRIRVDFPNLRYLLKGDRVSFWSQVTSSKKCQGEVMGKTNDYILLKVPFFDRCFKHAYITTGAYFNFYSNDLVSNLERGKEVVSLMLKKRMALEAKKQRIEREVSIYDNKVDALNQHYQVLRDRLDKDQQEALSDVDNERAVVVQGLQRTESDLNEIDYKLEQYRVSDLNLEWDRWSLDQRLYFKK